MRTSTDVAREVLAHSLQLSPKLFYQVEVRALGRRVKFLHIHVLIDLGLCTGFTDLEACPNTSGNIVYVSFCKNITFSNPE